MEIVLKTMPLSTNQLHGVYKGRKILSVKGRTNKETMAWEVRQQYRGEPLKGSVRLKIGLYWPTRRNHDVDNIKALLDSCTGILWEDDGQVVDLHVTKTYSPVNPRVEMELIEVDN